MLESRQEESITNINITPLVDIILVLLIIFMATAPLIHKRAMNINLPKAAHHEKKATETLELAVNEKKEVYLGGKKLGIPELAEELADYVRMDVAVHVAISADSTLPYGDVIGILDIVRGAGVKKVALEVKSKSSKK
ncbi:MAG TPA: biopolymer transporter ExbD [Elusimicrobiota bacterium]|nr:biopolymer transporter ExbD [Elusimicrobiota bacterium]